MNRRTFLKRTLASLAALCFSSCQKTPQPNFLFILIDDLGWSDLGCYGSTYHETPNIDKLAKSGMRFTNAYAACTVCSPTRASILTGNYPVRYNITNWIPGSKQQNAKLKMPEIAQELPHDQVTIAEALNKKGYVSAAIGKWHLGGEDFYPEQQGFDLNIAGTHKGSPRSYFSPYQNPQLADGPHGEYLTDRLADEAVQFIEQNKNNPFFLYLAHFAVHTPIQAKDELTDYYASKTDPSNLQSNAKYAAMIHSVDQAIGKIIQILNTLNLFENTVIIFTSDNGGLTWIETNAPLRSGKGSPYEGGHRVPLFMVYSEKIPAGHVCDVPVISTDFFPTIMDYAGLSNASATALDGKSLVPLLSNSGKIDRDELFWHFPHYHPGGATPYSAIRKGDFKLIEFFQDRHVELYNLAKDVSEHDDLAMQMPDKVSMLKQRLAAWRKKTGARLPVPNTDYDPLRENEKN